MVSQERKKYTKVEIVLSVLVIIQIVYLFLFNIFRMKYMVNMDSSEYLIQVIQIWRQKKLLISDYYYSTMLAWDMPTILATIFYGITKNVFVAWGMANNVLIALFITVLHKLCKDLEISRKGFFFITLSIFTVYQYGYVDYIEELFVNGSLYCIRIMLILLFIDLVFCLHKNKKSVGQLILFVVCMCGFFVCGMSTGVFEVGCGILPIFLFEFFLGLKQQDVKAQTYLKNMPFLMTVLAIFVSGLGMMVANFLGLSSSVATEKMTVPIDELGTTMSGTIAGLFQLFGWTANSVRLMSLDGILVVATAGVTLGVMLLLVASVILLVKKKLNLCNELQKYYIEIVFLTFIVDEALFCIADLNYSGAVFEYRYWLMVCIPLFIEIGIMYDWARQNCNVNYVKFIAIVGVVVLCGISTVKDLRMWKQDNGADAYENMMQTAADNEIQTIFVYGDYFSSRVITTYVKDDMEAFAICNSGIDDTGSAWQEGLRMPRWGTYVKYDQDILQQTPFDKCGLLVDKIAVGLDYEYLKAQADEVIPFENSNYELMIMRSWAMDLNMGIPIQGQQKSCDDFYGDYTRQHLVLNDAGQYQSDGTEGELIRGEFVADEDGTYDITLAYTLETGMASLEIDVVDTLGNEQIYQDTLEINQNFVTIPAVHINTGETYVVKIYEDQNTTLTLNNIEFQKVD